MGLRSVLIWAVYVALVAAVGIGVLNSQTKIEPILVSTQAQVLYGGESVLMGECAKPPRNPPANTAYDWCPGLKLKHR